MGSNFWGLPSVGWQAISTLASIVAFVIAGGAAFTAWKQYLMNVQERRDQSRPYVTVDFQLSPVSLDAMDLVVRNCGTTAAYALSVTMDPEPVRAHRRAAFDLERTRLLAGSVAMFAPGRTVTLFFDVLSERDGTDLPSTYDCTISYRDEQGRSFTERTTIDLNIARGVLNPGLLGLHHAASALQGIREDLHSSPLRLGPFPVVAESRVDYLGRIREEERPGGQPDP